MVIETKSVAVVVLLCCFFSASCEAKGRIAIKGKGLDQHGIIAALVAGKKDPSEKVFNVLQFGAKPDGKTDNQMAFMQAWRAACDWRGKARLLIPKGNFLLGPVVFQGPCKGPPPIIVQVVGTVKALTDLSSYEEDFWFSFERINGLVITGSGTFDGQGAQLWKYNDCKTSSSCVKLPASIKFMYVTDGIIRQITSVNPMGFHIGVVLSQKVRVRNIHLAAPAESPNTDGIHISQSSQVTVARSVIATGDDCVGMIQGSTDISIKKVTCGPGHGFSIGSLGKYPDEKDVRGVVVTNCTLKNTDNGLRIKTWADSPPSQASYFTFKDIIMENVKHPIIIDQNYGSDSMKPSRVKISDIRYINIRGTSSSEVGVDLQCSKQFPCDRLLLSNINLKYVGPKNAPFTSSCTNARITYAGVQFPPACRV